VSFKMNRMYCSCTGFL